MSPCYYVERTNKVKEWAYQSFTLKDNANERNESCFQIAECCLSSANDTK